MYSPMDKTSKKLDQNMQEKLPIPPYVWMQTHFPIYSIMPHEYLGYKMCHIF